MILQPKVALITGVTGQDGAYLAEFLLNKGYIVHGIKRRTSLFNTDRIDHLYKDRHNSNLRFFLHHGDLTDSSSLIRIIQETQPDEIYNLAAQSHVAVSFEEPEYTANSDALGALRLLEAIRILGLEKKSRFYQASTSELYGLVQEIPQRESTPFYPRSPYAVAKLYAYWITINYREAYKMYACNGILFNHESPIRGETFVTRKITRALARIKLGLQECLYLGNLDAKRDWGHARDYVEMQWLMLQQDEPEDYVIATGEQYSVRDFVNMAAEELEMHINWEGAGINEKGFIETPNGRKLIVSVDSRYFRPTEVETLLGDATKAKNKLGWTPKTTFKDLVIEMVQEDLRSAQRDELIKGVDLDQWTIVNNKFKNFLWLVLDKFFKTILGIFIIGITARYLGVELFGIVSISLVYASIFSHLTSLGLGNIVVREFVRGEINDAHIVQASILSRMIAGISLYIFLIIVMIFFEFEGNYFTHSFLLINSVILFKWVDIVREYYESKVQYKFIVIAETKSLIIVSLIKVALIFSGVPFYIFLYVYLIENIIVSYFVLMLLRPKFLSLTINPEVYKVIPIILRQSWPLIIVALSDMIVLRVDTIMLGVFSDFKEVGEYFAAIKIATIITMIPYMIVQTFIPSIIHAKKNSNKEFILKISVITQWLIILSYFIILIIYLFGDLIIILIYGDSFVKSKDILIIYSLSFPLMFLGVIGHQWYIANNMQIVMMVRSVSGSLLAIIASYFLTKNFGLNGALCSVMIGYSIVFLIVDAFFNRTKELFWVKIKAIFLLDLKLIFNKS